MNVYCEPAETPNGGKGDSRMMLVKVPGRAVTHELPDAPLRCLYSGDGNRVFAVSGSTLYELFQDGTYNALGTVMGGTSPAQIFSNGTQLFVVTGSKGYIADGETVDYVVDCCQGGYLDGYFLAVKGAEPGESKTFRISELLNGKSWPTLDFANVDQSPDNIQALLVDHRQALFLKQQTAVTYWDSGNTDFPFQPVEGSFVEQGCIAPWSAVRIDNTVMWLGGDERGAGIVWRMQGYTPVRVSNYAVEYAMQQSARAGNDLRNATALSEQYLGHAFYSLTFGTETWVYDCSTGLWHQRGVWNPATAQWQCDRARYHCYAWGIHLVGGGDDTGRVYEQAVAYQDDAGDALRWIRRSPHVANAAGRMVYYSNLFLDFQVGVGTESMTEQPTVMVRHSNDGGNTWNAEEQVALGKIGQYSYRARQVLCGSGRDRVIEVSGTDPVEIALNEASIDAVLGTS